MIAGHTAYICDRGGTQRLFQLNDLSRARWERDRDGTSEGSCVIAGDACWSQRDNLQGIEPKRHELVIFRGQERVWEGPVNRVTWHPDYVEVVAHDISSYVYGTPLSRVYDNRGTRATTVTARLQNILNIEMQRWETLTPPANVLPHVVVHNFPNEARTAAITNAYEMTVGEHLENYGRYGGIDWTVVGRSLHIWDVSRNLGRLRMMTEADFLGPVIVTAYGSDFASHVYVVGAEGAYGHAGTTDLYYGPWTKILNNYNEEGTTAPTQAELNSQAQRGLAGRNPVPVEVRVPDNSGVRMDRGIGINDLVPGVHIPLLATLNARPVSQLQKLDHVTVIETAEGETIQVVLTPASRSDADEEE